MSTILDLPAARTDATTVQEILEQARADFGFRVSDVHLDPGMPPSFVVDQVLQYDPNGPRVDSQTLLKLKRELNDHTLAIFEDKRECDFSMKLRDDSICRVHLSSLGHDRLYATIRLLPDRVMPFEQTGLPVKLTELLGYPSGLVIFSGPVGSGKSTALHSLLEYRNQYGPPAHILTIEDPIEYIHKNHTHALFHQRELDGDSAKDYPTAIAGSLRVRPDILVIGEARDKATMEQLITFGQLGKLAFTTTHSHDVAQTLARIVTMFEPSIQDEVRQNLKSVLLAIISVRLVPRVSGGVASACEIITKTPALEALIDRPTSLRGDIDTHHDHGWQSLEHSLATLLKSGVITRESAFKYANDRQKLQDRINVLK
jgi:twitching motility protein PilT